MDRDEALEQLRDFHNGSLNKEAYKAIEDHPIILLANITEAIQKLHNLNLAIDMTTSYLNGSVQEYLDYLEGDRK